MRRSLFWLLDHYPDTGESLASLHAAALAHAGVADGLGFEALWLAEHHFRTLGTAPNPAVVLAAIAQHTEHLRLGPAVSVLPLRDPIQVAEDYALVDLLSGGRLNMGVGTGSQPQEFAGFGCSFESRRCLFDDRLAALRRRWSAASCGKRGADALNVAPVQKPAPPIYVACMTEERAQGVGRAGDSMLTLVSPVAQHPSEVAAHVRAHTRGLEEAGHPKGAAESVVVVFAHVAESEAEARKTVAPAMARLLEVMAGAAPPDPEDLFERMRERGTGLFGTAESVEGTIERYAALGVEHLAFVTRFGGMPADAAERSLRHLSPAS